MLFRSRNIAHVSLTTLLVPTIPMAGAGIWALAKKTVVPSATNLVITKGLELMQQAGMTDEEYNALVDAINRKDMAAFVTAYGKAVSRISTANAAA